MADWQFVALVAAMGIFCIVRGLFDLRARRYAWGAIGVVIGLVVVCAPVQTHAVKVDLPVNR
jgi:bacteriorhodopsin